MFRLPKDLTITLVSGYNVQMRHRIVMRWQELESKVSQPAIPQSLPEALRLAADVAAVLGYSDAEAMTRRLDDDEKSNLQIVGLASPTGGRGNLVINESGLYHAVLKSRKPEAKRFRRWVTEEVLPSIRKTGAYLAPSATLESLPPAIARQVGGIIKAVVHKEVTEALSQSLPSLIHGDVIRDIRVMLDGLGDDADLRQLKTEHTPFAMQQEGEAK